MKVDLQDMLNQESSVRGRLKAQDKDAKGNHTFLRVIDTETKKSTLKKDTVVKEEGVELLDAKDLPNDLPESKREEYRPFAAAWRESHKNTLYLRKFIENARVQQAKRAERAARKSENTVA